MNSEFKGAIFEEIKSKNKDTDGKQGNEINHNNNNGYILYLKSIFLMIILSNIFLIFIILFNVNYFSRMNRLVNSNLLYSIYY